MTSTESSYKIQVPSHPSRWCWDAARLQNGLAHLAMAPWMIMAVYIWLHLVTMQNFKT